MILVLASELSPLSHNFLCLRLLLTSFCAYRHTSTLILAAPVQCIQPKEGTQLILATHYIFCCKNIILGPIASKVGVSVE